MNEPFPIPPEPPKKKRRWGRRLLALLVLAAVFPVLYSYVKCPFMPYYRTHFPKRTALMDYRLGQAEATGQKLDIRYKPVPLASISKSMQKAVVMAEDARFYEHDGIDVEAIKEAYKYNQRKGKWIRGGSTISQQVAKNLWLTPKRSFWRKLIEAILAWRMEQALSKERILEIYLNTIEWGRGVFGISAAAQNYFGASPANLSPQQAASLAAIIPSPLRSNPNAPTMTVERRRARILAGLIGKKAMDELEESESGLPPFAPADTAPKSNCPVAEPAQGEN